MSSDLLIDLLNELDAPQLTYAKCGRYYRGENNPLGSNISKESAAAIGDRLSRLVVNVPRILVNSLAERLRVTGMSCDVTDVWAEFIRNDLDQRAGIVHRSALLYGSSYVIAWGDGTRPIVTVESPLNVQVLTDPATGEITSACKRWEDKRKGETHAMLYLPDRLEHWRADTVGSANTSLTLIETLDNPLGAVPVTRFLNSDLLDDGVSEISDLIDLSDALSKITTDALVGSEFYAKPRRVLIGVELVERPKLNADNEPELDNDGNPIMEVVNPVPDNDRMIVLSDKEAKAIQLSASDLGGFKNLADLVLSEISAVSSLPPHYLGILHDNPSSEGSLKASEAGLTAKASAKMAAFGRSWEAVARLVAAIKTGRAVDSIECRVKWGDAGLRSESQVADSVSKLYGDGSVISRAEALRRLGYADDQVAAIIAESISEQKDYSRASADPSLVEFNSQFSNNAQFQRATNEAIGEAA